MKTKLLFIISVLFIIPIYSIYSQNRMNWEEKKDLIKSEKIAFFTEKLQLTPKEAEKFWPIYNEYEKRKWKLNKEKKDDYDFIHTNIDSISKKELEKYAYKYIEYNKKLTALDEEYLNKFMNILSSKKIITLYLAEREFKSHLLHRIRRRHRGDRAFY